MRPVHKPWIEILPKEDITWEYCCLDRYTGAFGGSKPGPSPWIKDVVHRAETLACIFLSIVPWSFFEMVAKWTSKYAYEDWVVEVLNERHHITLDCAKRAPGSRDMCYCANNCLMTVLCRKGLTQYEKSQIFDFLNSYIYPKPGMYLRSSYVRAC